MCAALHMGILSHPKDKQKGKLENGQSLTGNAPSCPSSLSHSWDGRPHNVRVTDSQCGGDSPVPQTVPSAGAVVTAQADTISSVMVSMVFVYRGREAPTLFVGTTWVGHSGMESVYFQQSLDPGSRCETNPHSPLTPLCRIQLPFTSPAWVDSPAQSLAQWARPVSLITCSVLSPVL